MRTGRPILPLTITNEERETLERWARHPTTGQAVAQRAADHPLAGLVEDHYSVISSGSSSLESPNQRP